MNLKTISDSEIGDLWRQIQPGKKFVDFYPIVVPIIRKFIENEVNHLKLTSNVEYYQIHALEVVLAKYNITLEEWN